METKQNNKFDFLGLFSVERELTFNQLIVLIVVFTVVTILLFLILKTCVISLLGTSRIKSIIRILIKSRSG
jgi:hypothetical protein